MLATGVAGLSPGLAPTNPPPVDEELWSYVVGVPSSLLSAAALQSGSTSIATYGAVAANSAVIAEGATFAPIATSAFAPALPAVGVVLAGVAVFEIGTASAKAVGVDYAALCAGDVPVLDQTLAAITLTDCTSWLQSAQLRAQLNADQFWQPNGAAVGATSCDPYGRCAKIYAVVPASTSQSEAGFCLVRTSGTLDSQHFPLVYDAVAATWYGGSSYKPGPYPPYTSCPASYTTNDRVAWVAMTVNNRPVTKWAANWDARIAAPQILPAASRSDPARVIRCTVRYLDGGASSLDTPVFHESEGIIPRPTCPGVPANEVAKEVELFLVTGAVMQSLGKVSVLDEYLDWRSTFPTCGTGECALELYQSGVSCFRQTVMCDGWLDDPDQASKYTCLYGGVTLDLSDCYIYGPLFNSANRSTGFAYGDPATGATVDARSSLLETDRLARRLIERPWESWGPTPTGLALGKGDKVAQARRVAARCVELGVSDQCWWMPIFVPGDDIREAAQHDLDALRGTTGPAQSPILEHGAASAPPGWYSSTSPCVTGTYVGATHHCDEYPFYSTTTAGPGASLRPIDKVDNTNEGLYLQHFYGKCAPQLVLSGELFLTIPVPTTLPNRTTETSQWC